MRIGIDCRSLQERYPTGVSVYTQQLLKAMLALPEAGQHTFVFFMNGYALRKEPERLRAIQSMFTHPSVEWRVRSLPNKIIPALEYVASSPSAEWMFGEVDVIFIPNLQFFPVREMTTPTVLTIHDLSFERFPECLDLKGRLRHRMLQPRRFVEHAQKIIAVSDHTKQELVELYRTSAEKIEIIYPGLTPVSATRELSASLDLPELYLLFISTIEPRKNVDTLLSAFEQVRVEHPDLHLVIAGAPGWKSARTMERIKHIPNVKWIGYVTEEQKQELYRRAALFVYPSLYEGFGFPPLEAQQYGVPVLVGSHSSLPEVLRESALYGDVLDVHSIARGIHHALTDTALRKALIIRGQQNVTRFSWQTAAQQTLNTLTTV